MFKEKGECTCKKNYYGEMCNVRCLNGVAEGDICACDDGFVGNSCEIKCSDSDNCSGYGSCQSDGQCKCDRFRKVFIFFLNKNVEYLFLGF